MKVDSLKRITFLLILVFLIPILWNQDSITAKAATPSLNKTNIEIAGTGEVYQLKIRNKKTNCTYQWSSSNNSVAKVSSSGLITTIKKGSAKIKCRIKYASGSIMNLYCIVTVTIPATEISINNAQSVNGAFVMRVGQSYNFDTTLTPSNSSDQTYWSLDTSDEDLNPNAIRIDNSSNGAVTALRTGKIVLVATAAKTSSAKAAENSDVKDAIIIEVVGEAPEVVSAEFIDSKNIKVVFGTAIRKSTLIDSNGKLSSNIEVARLEDSLGNKAKDPGTLTASLSSSLKVLTITANDSFNGNYGITFTNKILTDAGSAIYSDYKQVSFSDGSSNSDTSDTSDDTTDDTTTPDGTTTDTSAPQIASTVLDDTGMTTIITFTEKMDFTKFNVSNARFVSGSSTALSGTINFLNNKSNYRFSSDGKSISIDLTNISSEDYNKAFAVTISGITDTAGNQLTNNSAVVGIRTSTSLMPQARPISVIRTSYDTITATFDRSIKKPGYANINHSSYLNGEVNLDNNKQVIYKIPSYNAVLTGTQIVSIGHWDSYNVVTNDTYANDMHDFQVYFTSDNIRPVLSSYKYNPDLNILTLTYSENVTLPLSKGSIGYTMDSYQYNSYNNTGFLNYTNASAVGNVIEIMLSNMTLYGDYTFTLPEGFAMDDYHNLSYSNKITINNGSIVNDAGKLAEPYSIYQSDVNHSFIYIQFADKIDETTALNTNNYSISGVTITEVKLISNTNDGATIRLTMNKGAIPTTGARKIMITGLTGYNGSPSQMADYSTSITLIENTDPVLKTVKYNATLKNVIELTFSEPIKGSMVVTVQGRSTGYPIGNTVTVSGNVVSITLTSIPTDGTYLTIYVQSNSITDASGNESTISPELSVFANY